jgi:hypothetical protein
MHWGFQLIAWVNPFYHGVRMGQSLLWNEAILATWSIHGPALILSILVFGSIARHLIRKKLVR